MDKEQKSTGIKLKEITDDSNESTDKIPLIYVTEDEKRAYRLAGDRACTGPNATYNTIKDWGF